MRISSGRTLTPLLLLAVVIPAGAGAAAASAAPAAVAPAAVAGTPRPHFGLSGLRAENGGAGSEAASASTRSAPSTSGAPYRAAAKTGHLIAGPNVDVIGHADVVQRATINGASVNTCNPGKHTAQNETTIAANGSTLVGGTNDYRLYEPSENRYDSSGGVYRSANGGKTWSAGFLPGLVRANTAAPGPYESAGDPVVAAGSKPGVFWYANLVFNRTDAASGVAASRTADGGKTWSTHYPVQTSAADGASETNDKDWIGADPSDPTGNTAYVTWTLFVGDTAAILVSKTTDGGRTWSAPHQVSDVYTSDQGSVVQVDRRGTVYVTYEAYDPASDTDTVAFSVSRDGGATFTTRLLATDNDMPSPLPGATFRNDSFPAFALDGSTLHVVWADWNGTTASVLYMRSTDGGATWSSPVTLAASASDQFFPWIAARHGTVYASWLTLGAGDTYTATAAASADNGARWSPPVTVSSTPSDVQSGNAFGYPDCAFSFIGDYSGITVDADGVGHPLWTDVRVGPFDSPGNADQDPYTATLKATR